jgi:hypothetical protein
MDAATSHIAMGDPVSGNRRGGHGTGGVGLAGGGGGGLVGDAVGEVGGDVVGEVGGDAVGEAGEGDGTVGEAGDGDGTVGEAGLGATDDAEGVGQEPGGPQVAEAMITSPWPGELAVNLKRSALTSRPPPDSPTCSLSTRVPIVSSWIVVLGAGLLGTATGTPLIRTFFCPPIDTDALATPPVKLQLVVGLRPEAMTTPAPRLKLTSLSFERACESAPPMLVFACR